MISSRARIARMLVLVFVLLIVARPALSTDRYFADITATSPNGRFRLEAKSPDNAPGRRVPFQTDFHYTLTDTRTQQVMWTHRQAADGEAAPLGAWVHDSGWSAVWTAWNDLVVRPSDSDKPTGKVNILDRFPADETARYVHQTTAGPKWSHSSRWYFVQCDGLIHFVVRAWWGRRVIVETTTGQVKPDQGPIHAAAIASERADILAILAWACEQPGPPIDPATGRYDYEVLGDILAAAHLAGRERIVEAIPSLLALEEWEYSGMSSTWPVWFDNPLPQGEVDPFSYSQFTVRATAQTSLRRLGAVPIGLPATQFKFEHQVYARRRPVPTSLIGERSEYVADVRPGMSPRDVLGLVGAPDAVERWQSTMAWEYDLDVDPPFTLQVVWKKQNPPVVDIVRRLSPPQWANGDVRDER